MLELGVDDLFHCGGIGSGRFNRHRHRRSHHPAGRKNVLHFFWRVSPSDHLRRNAPNPVAHHPSPEHLHPTARRGPVILKRFPILTERKLLLLSLREREPKSIRFAILQQLDLCDITRPLENAMLSASLAKLSQHRIGPLRQSPLDDVVLFRDLNRRHVLAKDRQSEDLALLRRLAAEHSRAGKYLPVFHREPKRICDPRVHRDSSFGHVKNSRKISGDQWRAIAGISPTQFPSGWRPRESSIDPARGIRGRASYARRQRESSGGRLRR